MEHIRIGIPDATSLLDKPELLRKKADDENDGTMKEWEQIIEWGTDGIQTVIQNS